MILAKAIGIVLARMIAGAVLGICGAVAVVWGLGTTVLAPLLFGALMDSKANLWIWVPVLWGPWLVFSFAYVWDEARHLQRS